MVPFTGQVKLGRPQRVESEFTVRLAAARFGRLRAECIRMRPICIYERDHLGATASPGTGPGIFD